MVISLLTIGPQQKRTSHSSILTIFKVSLIEVCRECLQAEQAIVHHDAMQLVALSHAFWCSSVAQIWQGVLYHSSAAASLPTHPSQPSKQTSQEDPRSTSNQDQDQLNSVHLTKANQHQATNQWKNQVPAVAGLQLAEVDLPDEFDVEIANTQTQLQAHQDGKVNGEFMDAHGLWMVNRCWMMGNDGLIMLNSGWLLMVSFFCVDEGIICDKCQMKIRQCWLASDSLRNSDPPNGLCQSTVYLRFGAPLMEIHLENSCLKAISQYGTRSCGGVCPKVAQMPFVSVSPKNRVVIYSSTVVNQPFLGCSRCSHFEKPPHNNGWSTTLQREKGMAIFELCMITSEDAGIGCYKLVLDGEFPNLCGYDTN